MQTTSSTAPTAFVLLVFGWLMVTGCSRAVIPSSPPAVLSQDHPKNIVLLIGDGMGLSQMSALIYTQKQPSSFEQFTHLGFHKSYSWSDLITDSAAGATAFACGVKTFNNAIGLDKDTLPVQSILEEAEENLPDLAKASRP